MTTALRTLGVVTVSRADYGILLPVLKRLATTPDVELWVYATGTHLEERFGCTVLDIERDGFTVRERVPISLISDSPDEIAAAMGRGVSGFATALSRSRPDVLLLAGDRFDTLPAAIAALPLRIPLAHIHGGEVSHGAIDDSIRHAITKLSHLHFPATAAYARRIEQLGEEPWRITISGAPSLDNMLTMPRLSREAIESKIGMRLSTVPLLVTFHAATLDAQPPERQIAEVLAGLNDWTGPIVFTGVNADPGNRAIRAAVESFAATREHVRVIENLGTSAYFTLMTFAAAMIGNSSSGLIEAPSFELPVVNIRPRQDGRLRAKNVIDSACEKNDIAAALQRATSAEFRASLRGLVNPYGDGHAAERIVSRLINEPLNERLLVKRFHDQT
jgi:UDP-hydrolysing UDP-N-acetyl-D-glucosamine 2-epimerase